MFEETFVSGDGVLQARVDDDLSYSLVFRKGGKVLVEYGSASGYDFKSVEKLRYDFERDVEKALSQG